MHARYMHSHPANWYACRRVAGWWLYLRPRPFELILHLAYLRVIGVPNAAHRGAPLRTASIAAVVAVRPLVVAAPQPWIIAVASSTSRPAEVVGATPAVVVAAAATATATAASAVVIVAATPAPAAVAVVAAATPAAAAAAAVVIVAAASAAELRVVVVVVVVGVKGQGSGAGLREC